MAVCDESPQILHYALLRSGLLLHDRKLYSPVLLSFALSHSVDVALELFDISGKRAALIASERFAPGIHERYLETKAIARGAYIYRYTIEGKSYTGKLVVE